MNCHWRNDMTILLIFLILWLRLSSAYKRMCPDASQWGIRARLLCPDPSKYFCLLDYNAKVYIENCTRFDITRRGERYLIQGDLNSVFCSKNVYQPFRYYTNVSSDCIFKKSLCKEEGQVVYDNGDPDKDRKCTCDYTKRYDFVTTPSNPCYCVPSLEDCSCFINPCMTSTFKLENRCTYTNVTISKGCLPFQNNTQEEGRNTTEPTEQAIITLSVRESMNHKDVRSMIVCSVIVVGLCVIVVVIDYILSNHYRKIIVIEHLAETSCIEGDECILQCQLSESSYPVHWYKDNNSIENSFNVIAGCEGSRYKLTIKSMSRDDEGEYQLKTGTIILTRASVRCLQMPASLNTLNEEDKKLYKNLIKSGTEVRRYIRILILGKHSVGKSCLLRRLLGESIEGVESTDGIDIVVRRCKIRLSDGEWIIDEDVKDDDLVRIKRAKVTSNKSEPSGPDDTDDGSTQNLTKLISRKLTSLKSKDTGQLSDETKRNDSSNHPSTSYTDEENDKNEPHPSSSGKTETHSEPSSSVTESSKPTELAERTNQKATRKIIEKQLDDILIGIENVEVPSDQFVECGFWDFAGEKDYYVTHQIFLHPYALYLLVADITDDFERNTGSDFNSIGEYLDYWFDNIHFHGSKANEGDDEDEKLNPPVIVVGTGIDKIKNQSELKKKINAFETTVLEKGKKVLHLRDICFVSNKDVDKGKFGLLKKSIFKHGKSLKTFSEELPLVWIQMEKLFDDKRNDDINILKWQDVYNLSIDIGINDPKELNVFLKFQHAVGNIIYFESIQNYIIINPKWLANAFRCLISNKIDAEIKTLTTWLSLRATGELHPSLVTKLFKKAPELQFDKFQNHILNIMEAFDTIIKPVVSVKGQTQRTSEYFMPCMIESTTSLDAILQEFGVKKRTPWICFEFNFLPLSFFNHILVHLMKKYPMCSKPSTKLAQPAIYQSSGVFFIEKTECIKLFVCFCKNTVAIQLWHWVDIPKGTCNAILVDIKQIVGNMKRKYSAKQVICTVKAKCAVGMVEKTAGRISYQKLRNSLSPDQKYMCHEHQDLHDSRQIYQTWYEEYNEMFAEQEETANGQNVEATEDFRDPRFHQRCPECDNETSICWCYECRTSLCQSCSTHDGQNHFQNQDNESKSHKGHHLQHELDKYNWYYDAQVDGIFTDIKVVDDKLLCIAKMKSNESNSNELVTLDLNGTDQRSTKLTHAPFRLVVVDKKTVAVTFYDKQGIAIVDTKSNDSMIIDINADCGGIIYQRKCLVVGCYDKTLKELSLEGVVRRSIRISFIPDCICGFGNDRIFGVDNENVYCINSEGRTLFTIHETGGPCAVTVDDTGNALVVCNFVRNILKISPDGKSEVIIERIPTIGLLPYMTYITGSQLIVIGSQNVIDLYKKTTI